MNIITKTIQYGQHTLTLETGGMARQATSSVLAKMGDTVVLATLVVKKEAPEQLQGMPGLMVVYQERSYAAGKIPGGYFKREGRPGEGEILYSRLIDRSIRPLIPDGFENEIQIVVTLLSLDPQITPDIPSMIAASTAVMLSGIPFNGPMAAARIGFQDGFYILNPSASQLAQSQLDLVVAASHDAVIMVESEAKQLSEKVMLGSIVFGQTEMQPVIQIMRELVAEANVPSWNWQPPAKNVELETSIKQHALEPLKQAYQIREKQERYNRIDEILQQVLSQLTTPETESAVIESIKRIFHNLESDIVRQNILRGELRIDGRDHKTVRTITIKPKVLPRTHGSVLFTRGETQALVVATLGKERDAQMIDAVEGERKERFMLHYNFPPFSVGEIGQIGSPKRREVGHGNLARRAIMAVLPEEKDFPYVLRIVSEILESNGSSSMATVCGSSLALMDAGVPLKAPVAGIAMGLVKEGEQFAVLTDILGDEDHLGDMDFKVAGTAEGVTALQMDIKIAGITPQIMETALAEAKTARLYILDIMNGILSQPREALSPYAPRIISMKIDVDKIRDVIGKGGATIRSIIEETGASIDISDDGMVSIASVDVGSGEAAMKRIQDLTTDIEVGQVYEGKVSRLADFGAFVSFSGKEGLLHISQIAHERVEKVTDYYKEGDKVRIKVLEIDKQGRIRLSAKALLDAPSREQHSEQQAEM